MNTAPILALWFFIKAPLIAYLCIFFLWVFFTAIMRIEMVRDAKQLTPLSKFFGYQALAVGLVLDLIADWFIVSFILLEFPQETTVSARLHRWTHSPDPSWRKTVCLFFRAGALDNVDPAGEHLG